MLGWFVYKSIIVVDKVVRKRFILYELQFKVFYCIPFYLFAPDGDN